MVSPQSPLHAFKILPSNALDVSGSLLLHYAPLTRL